MKIIMGISAFLAHLMLCTAIAQPITMVVSTTCGFPHDSFFIIEEPSRKALVEFPVTANQVILDISPGRLVQASLQATIFCSRHYCPTECGKNLACLDQCNSRECPLQSVQQFRIQQQP